MDLRLLRRRLIITALVLGICIAGTSLALFQRAQHASAATAPYFMTSVGGQKYVAQYVGHAYSNQNSHSIYSDFGQWNEYTVDGSGTWHWYGQFSGNEDVFYNAHGQAQGGMNINVPGIGNINTYGHEQVLNPSLPNPPYPYLTGRESYMGERFARARFATGYFDDCEVDEANFNGTTNNGTAIQLFDKEGTTDLRRSECAAGNGWLLSGDSALTNYYNQFTQLAATPHVNGPVVASLHHQQFLPIPVVLGIAGGVFFLGSVVTGAICNFATCSRSTQVTLAALSLGMGIISGVLGIGANILTSLKAFATASPALVPAIAQEAAGAVEMAGALRGGILPAYNEANTVVATSLTRSYSFP